MEILCYGLQNGNAKDTIMLANEILFEEKKMSLKDVGEWFQNYDHGGMFKRGKKGLIKPQVIAVQQFLTDNGF